MIVSLVIAVAVSAQPTGFVIAIGNNQSPVLGRPQLAYADDDAVRAAELFETILDAPTVELLTDPDSDTARLYPAAAARAKSPTRAAVQAAFDRSAAWARQRKAQGLSAHTYVVFAGHGDIEAGEGLLELADGPLRASELEALLRSVPADALHVVLDSCNSYFVLSPRRPGGHHFPTPAEATAQLVERLPNVGVILSTSAEAEVFEWSDLQAGIFSYVLRSGLTGAADANHDGVLGYDELGAFVDHATKAIKNPNLRPHIFVRGPGGSTAQPFLALAEAQLGLVGTDVPTRIRLRDAQGVRSFDSWLTKDVVLRVPPRLAQGGEVERFSEGKWQAHRVPSAGLATVEALTVVPLPSASRGRESEALSALFETPFGSEAVEHWTTEQSERATQDAMGVSSEVTNRVATMLTVGAEHDRANRVGSGIILASLGVSFGLGFGGYGLATNDPFVGWAGLGGGVLLAASSLLSLLPSRFERQASLFQQRVAAGQPAKAIIELDRYLEEASLRRSWERVLIFTLSGLLIAEGLAMGAIGFFVGPDATPVLQMWGGAVIALGAGFILSTLLSAPPERELETLLRGERARGPKINVSVAPSANGASVVLTGRF